MRPKLMCLCSLLLVAALPLVGCDRGAHLLEECTEAVAKLPTQAPEGETMWTRVWGDAAQKCQDLADSKSKQAAQGQEHVAAIEARRKEIEGVLLGRKTARENAERQAARQAVIAACPQGEKWVSVCELNGQPTGGAFYKNTLDECEEMIRSAQSIGAKCVRCGCADNLVKVMNQEFH